MTQTDPHPPSTASRAPGTPLTLKIGSDAGVRSYTLDRPRIVVGRGKDCDIVLADRTVSRRHLVLEVEDGLVRFRDLGGTNVPVLDGQETRAGLLAPGSFLLVGMTRLEVEAEPDPDRTREIADPRQTVTVLRREPGTTAAPPAELGGIAAIRALHREPLSGPEFVAELAPRLLRSALALTGRTRGVLARRSADGHLQVLASVPTDPTLFPLPAQALDFDVDLLAVDPWPEGPPELERILVPCGPDGLFVLGMPAAAAPRTDDALTIAMEFAPIAAAEMEDARHREAERHELDQLRFRQSHTGRAVQACTRLQALRRRVAEAAAHGRPLRVIGEEGCESEEIARYYHACSPDQAGPFVACYARLLPPHRIAEDLREDHGVREGNLACDARAAGGTLFVDSPEALPQELQARLAEIAERNTRDTSDRHFRLVVSTVLEHGGSPPLHPDLARALASCTECFVPPLRTAPEDIIALAEVILEDLGPTPGESPRRISEDAESLLRSYHWPGNTRQHRRAIEIAAARAGSNPIEPHDLPVEVRKTSAGASDVATIREVERDHIRRTMDLCGGNKTRAAHRLGISKSTLYGKLKRLGLDE